MGDRRQLLDWAEALKPMTDAPVYDSFLPTCLEWERHAPKRPVRGRLNRLVAKIVGKHWQVFSEEFLEQRERRAEADLARETCVRWKPSAFRMKPFDGRTITWGEATTEDTNAQ